VRACVSESGEGGVTRRAMRTEEDFANAGERLSPGECIGYSHVFADSWRQRERWRTVQ
jgi:hypothetical protein